MLIHPYAALASVCTETVVLLLRLHPVYIVKRWLTSVSLVLLSSCDYWCYLTACRYLISSRTQIFQEITDLGRDNVVMESFC